jgi:hypothetical protein
VYGAQASPAQSGMHMSSLLLQLHECGEGGWQFGGGWGGQIHRVVKFRDTCHFISPAFGLGEYLKSYIRNRRPSHAGWIMTLFRKYFLNSI